MDAKTARALNAINRSFYAERAAEFSATRRDPWPGWTRLPPLLRRHLRGRPPAVLDVGCGDGRFAAYLADALPEARGALRYCGVDASHALLAALRERELPFASVATRCRDIVATPLAPGCEAQRFDLIAVFGLLHHVPGECRRTALLRTLVDLLAPGGLLALAIWRFEEFERFRRRRLPWADWNAAADEPVDTGQLEAGDHLLRWGADGGALRYCHFADSTEVARWLRPLPLDELARYDADGREGTLNRYFVLRTRGGA